MHDAPSTPEERYARIVEALASRPDVTPPADVPRKKKFGNSLELRVANKIFAILVQGRLVVKLPQQRVDALIAAGDGVRFDPGHGRLMKEWVTIEPTSDLEWLPLASEALEFVASRR